MDNNYTVLAAYVTALAAIIAPTITALIHSLKEYKISKFTSTIQERLKLCKQFSESYAKCQYGDQRVEFMKAFYKHSMELIALCHHRSTRRAFFTLQMWYYKKVLLNILTAFMSIAFSYFLANSKI